MNKNWYSMFFNITMNIILQISSLPSTAKIKFTDRDCWGAFTGIGTPPLSSPYFTFPVRIILNKWQTLNTVMVNGLVFHTVLCAFVTDIFSCWQTALHPSHVVQHHLRKTSLAVHAETSRKITANASALKCISVNQAFPPVASWFLSLYIDYSKF